MTDSPTTAAIRRLRALVQQLPPCAEIEATELLADLAAEIDLVEGACDAMQTEYRRWSSGRARHKRLMRALARRTMP